MTPAPAMPTINGEAAPRECPLCAATIDIEVGSLSCPAYWRHPDNDCLFRNHGFSPASLAAWNRRAPDEAMRARIVAAEAERDANLDVARGRLDKIRLLQAEVDRQNAEIMRTGADALALTAERDRLRAALEELLKLHVGQLAMRGKYDPEQADIVRARAALAGPS